MPDRDSFVAAIAAAPADDLPRLVFADWLDESGDPDRARFIRDQIALTKLRPGTAEYQALFRRTADTLRANLPGWVQSACDAFGQPADWKAAKRNDAVSLGLRLRPDGPLSRLTFRRGFVDQVELHVGRVAEPKQVADLFRQHPISRLILVLVGSVRDPAEALPPSPLSARRLLLYGAMTPDSLDAVFASAALANVTHLDVDGRLIADRLARSPMARRLTALRVPPDPDVLAALREYPLDDRMYEFVVAPMTWQPPTTEFWSALSRVAFRPTLKRLDLTGCGMTDDGLAAFARGEEWVRLQGLKLGGNRFGDAGWADFCRGWRTPELTYLDVSRNRLADAAAVALARSGMVRTLRTIDLRGNKIGGRGAVALATAVRAGPLVRLLLAGNPLRPKDVAAVRKLLGERADVGG